MKEREVNVVADVLLLRTYVCTNGANIREFFSEAGKRWRISGLHCS